MHNRRTAVNEPIFIQHYKNKRFTEESEDWLEEPVYMEFYELSGSFA